MQRAFSSLSFSGKDQRDSSEPSQQAPLPAAPIPRQTHQRLPSSGGVIFRALFIGSLLLTMAHSIGSAQDAHQTGALCGAISPAVTREYALSIAKQDAGPVIENSLSPHFYNSAGTISVDMSSSSPPRKSFVAAETAFAAQSRHCSRDVEVKAWSRNGMVFVRADAAGRAVYFMHNGESQGYLEIGIVTNLDVHKGFRYADGGGDFYPLYKINNIATLYPGYDGSSAGVHVFTFGVRGFDIYAKLDAVELARFQEYRHMAVGRVATQNRSGYGFRALRVRYLADKVLESAYTEGVYNLADFGMRELNATGSIDAGSAVLRLVANPGFRVGDYIIVATGAEKGRGKRGTTGVGGTWPNTSYPSLDAMRSDRSRPAGSYAWLEETGDVHRYGRDGWMRMVDAYYTEKVIPRALRARVEGISEGGRVLILDRPASASAHRAAIHFDNQPILQKVLRDAKFDGEMNFPRVTIWNDFSRLTPDGIAWVIPPGSYALGDSIIIHRHTSWRLQGSGRNATTLFSPRGAPSAMLWVLFAPGTTISDLHVKGNARDHGFMLSGNPQFVSDMNLQQGHAYPSGILLGQESHGSRAARVKVTDAFQKAVGADFCDGCWAQDVDVFMTDGLRDYIQWMYQWADSVGGGCIDCSITSPYLVAGFEAFKSKDVQFLRPMGVNAIVAMNAAGGFLIDQGLFIIGGGSQHADLTVSSDNPVISINSNIGYHPYLELGGMIRDTSIIHEGYINPADEMLAGIVVNENNPHIAIEGGVYDAPRYGGPSSGGGARGLVSTGEDIWVDGFRVNGVARGFGIYGANIGFTSGVVKNCVADVVRTTGGAVVDCTTTREADEHEPWRSPLARGQPGAPCITAIWSSMASGKAFGVQRSWSRGDRCSP